MDEDKQFLNGPEVEQPASIGGLDRKPDLLGLGDLGIRRDAASTSAARRSPRDTKLQLARCGVLRVTEQRIRNPDEPVRDVWRMLRAAASGL